MVRKVHLRQILFWGGVFVKFLAGGLFGNKTRVIGLMSCVFAKV